MNPTEVITPDEIFENIPDGASEASTTPKGNDPNKLRRSIDSLTNKLAGAGQHIADTASEQTGEDIDGLKALKVYAFHKGNRATKRTLAYARKPLTGIYSHRMPVLWLLSFAVGTVAIYAFAAWIYTLSAPVGAIILFLVSLNFLASIGTGAIYQAYQDAMIQTGYTV